jgi:hypothetical protein
MRIFNRKCAKNRKVFNHKEHNAASRNPIFTEGHKSTKRQMVG